jgi:outer membrane protein assembly factor BamB
MDPGTAPTDARLPALTLFPRPLFMSLALALAACSHKVEMPPTAGDWPMYQLRADHNAFIDRPFSASWSADMGSRINGGLAVVGDVVLLDTFAPEVVALDARSGAVLWRSRAKNVLMSTPVVRDGLIFVGSGHNGRLHQPPDSRFTYTPEADGDPVWGRPEGDDVMALDLATGEERWRYHTVGEDMPSPALDGDVLVFANGDLHAYGLRANSGKAVWKRELNGLATMASAAVVDGKVVVSVCNDAPYRCETDALQPRSGKVVWRATEGNSDASPASGGGNVFVSSVHDVAGPYAQGGTTTVAALDARTGRVVWRYQTHTAQPYTEVGSAERAVAGTYSSGTYYQAIPSEDELVAFDAKSGRVKWHFKSRAPIKMSPVVARGSVYVGDGAGLFYVIDAATGKLVASRSFRRSFTVSPPVVMGQTVLVANDSVVYAIPTT